MCFAFLLRSGSVNILLPYLMVSIKADSNENIKLIICPKCGYQAQNDNDPLITAHDGLGECPSCGVIVSKYDDQNASEEQDDENNENFTGFADGHIMD